MDQPATDPPNQQVASTRTESRIFELHKTVGLVSTHVPCTLRYIHKRRENFITTCSGKSLNTFVGQQLKLISVSESANDDINCLASDTYHVYTAVGNKIYAWRRGTELKHTYVGDHTSDVTLLLPFGENIISTDVDGRMCIHDIKTEATIRTAKFHKETFNPTVMMHPLSFENKILVGSSQGLIQLWNINGLKLIHHFDAFAGCKINAIVQAPSRGVIAVGLANNKIALYNFEFGETIMVLDCQEEPVSIAFRTDNPSVIIAGGVTGSITAWDLERKEIICYSKEAHQTSVTGLVAFMSEPILVSSSSDNSVKVWIFDKPDGGFRLLNSREGHRLPPSLVRFHGENYLSVLTAGADRCLRSFHIHNETYNRTINNYIPRSDDEEGRGVPIARFANYGGNHRPLAEDVVGYNTPGTELYTFSVENSKKGKNLILPDNKIFVSCIYLTSDNQWAVVGFDSGELKVFNLQSKMLRKQFGENNKAHLDEVTGIVGDINGLVIASGSVDNFVKFWDFEKRTCIETLNCGVSILTVFSKCVSNLFGVVLSSYEILVCDISTFGIVRKLKGSTHPITCATFSSDMKWVTAATSDGCIRTWDVPTSNLIDIFRLFDGIVTSMDYSPNGEFLVTTISGNLGITIWVNQSLYDHISLLPIPTDYEPEYPGQVLHSRMSSLGTTELDDYERSLTDEQFFRLQDINNRLVSLGKLPSYTWTDLINLKDIKDRNKPVTPFKKKETIPFMLSNTMNGNGPEGVPSMGSNNEVSNLRNSSSQDASRILSLPMLRSPLGEQLYQLRLLINTGCECGIEECDCATRLHCKGLIKTLENMGPSQLDLEIRSLDPDCGGSTELLEEFLNCMTVLAKEKQYFQTVQTCLALFLKIYQDAFLSNPDLVLSLQNLHRYLEESRGTLLRSVTTISGLTDFTTNDLF